MISWVDISKGPELPYKGEPFQMPLNLKLVENLLFFTGWPFCSMNSQRKRLPSPPWQYVATFISHCNALPTIKQCIDAGATGALLPGSHRWSALGLVRSTPGVHYIATDQIQSYATRKIRKKTMNKMPQFWSALCVYMYILSEWVNMHLHMRKTYGWSRLYNRVCVCVCVCVCGSVHLVG